MAKWKDDTMAELLADVQRKPTRENELNRLAVENLAAFSSHPFKRYSKVKMREMETSIRENGILTPLLVRPAKTLGQYEILSGHNRWTAARHIGLREVPVVIKDVDDDTAILMMVESNFQQREELLPSEKAFAYKMKLDALKRQGKQSESTSVHCGQKWTARDTVAQEAGESAQNIRRYIRLTHLISPLLQKVDEKKLGFIPAVDLSYLRVEEQTIIVELMQSQGIKPSKAQAEQLKRVSQQQKLTRADIHSVFHAKKTHGFSAWRPAERFQSYLPKAMRQDMTMEKADAILEEAMRLWLEKYTNE